MGQQTTGDTLIVHRTGLTRHQGARVSVFGAEYLRPEPGAAAEPQLAVKMVILEPERGARRELLSVGDEVRVGGDTLRVERITSKHEGGPTVILRRAA